MNKIEAAIGYNYFRDGYEVYFRSTSPDGTKAVATDVTFSEAAASGIMVEPPLVLERPAVQRIMDDLWNSGLRPTNAPDTSDQHLDDMRTIAFAKLKIDKPGK